MNMNIPNLWKLRYMMKKVGRDKATLGLGFVKDVFKCANCNRSVTHGHISHAAR